MNTLEKATEYLKNHETWQYCDDPQNDLQIFLDYEVQAWMADFAEVYTKSLKPQIAAEAIAEFIRRVLAKTGGYLASNDELPIYNALQAVQQEMASVQQSDSGSGE